MARQRDTRVSFRFVLPFVEKNSRVDFERLSAVNRLARERVRSMQLIRGLYIGLESRRRVRLQSAGTWFESGRARHHVAVVG